MSATKTYENIPVGLEWRIIEVTAGEALAALEEAITEQGWEVE